MALWSPLLGFRSAFEACLASGAKSEMMYLSIDRFCRNDARCWMLLHMTEDMYVTNTYTDIHTYFTDDII